MQHESSLYGPVQNGQMPMANFQQAFQITWKLYKGPGGAKKNPVFKYC